MIEVTGDIWDYHEQGYWIVITTNGTVRKDGACVMGRGVALQAAKRFPDLPYKLGNFLNEFTNTVKLFAEYRIITFPVKHNWWESAEIHLIEESCRRLRDYAGYFFPGEQGIYMVRPGCGSGGLDWKDVKPILEKYLDDRFIVVCKQE